ncbi:MAG: FAD-binding oxidoreductase, partial [Rhodoblastus sp.]
MPGIAFPAPDPDILGRRDVIIAGLAALVAPECLVVSEDERRAFETDALTAYRRLPLAVVLPRSTEEASNVMAYLHAQGVKVVPRGAGTSLSGGAIPQEDAVVIGVSKMSRILDVDYADRIARVQAGVTNLGISDEVAADGFFYAP